MIKINLNVVQREKINNELIKFIDKSNILSKCDDLILFLHDQSCDNTANHLKESIKENHLFLIKDKRSLLSCISNFEKEILADSVANNIKPSVINKFIRYGFKDDDVQGFNSFYASFSTSDMAYEILEIINARVCPYCNRQYTFTARKNEVRVRPQFDHFFPQSLYPYLAISVYNLIPSCALCNCGKRAAFPKNILYPYEESFESKGIRFAVDDIIPYLLGDKDNVNVSLTPSNPSDIAALDTIKEYYKEFKIKILYDEHADYIKDLILKKYIFNSSAMKSIYNSYSDVLECQQRLEQLIFGKYEVDDFINNPLSKFTSDIFNDI